VCCCYVPWELRQRDVLKKLLLLVLTYVADGDVRRVPDGPLQLGKEKKTAEEGRRWMKSTVIRNYYYKGIDGALSEANERCAAEVWQACLNRNMQFLHPW
jgi:hypothetical protein